MILAIIFWGTVLAFSILGITIGSILALEAVLMHYFGTTEE